MRKRIWTPPDRGKPIDVADLDAPVPGPDARYQTHGPGCRCGEAECPWWRGEEVRRRWEAMTSAERQQMTVEAYDAFRDPVSWQLKMMRSLTDARRRGIFGWRRKHD